MNKLHAFVGGLALNELLLTLAFVGGLALIALGVGAIFWPAGLIVAGLELAGTAYLYAAREESP